MKTPNIYFLIGGSILIILTAFTFRLINADYFAPSENCDEIVRYMSGCSLSCTENGPIGRYSCEKTIDTDEQTLTTCTRQPYNPAITGRDNGAYETTSTLGGCTLTCGGGYAVCRGDAPERGGSITPSTPPIEPEHSSGSAQGDTQIGTCQGSIPANASGTSASTYLQTYTTSSRVPADNLERTYSASPGTCSFSCDTGYERDGSTCKASVGTITYNGYVIMDRNLGASRVCTSLTDTECYGNYYQRGNNYGFPGADKGSASAAGITTSSSQVAPTVGYSSSTFITTNPRMNNGSANRNAVGDTLWGGTLDTTTANGAGTTSAGRRGPCPVGFHVPSTLERKNMLNGGNPSSLFSTLKLPLAGTRIYSVASPGDVGGNGNYWSSSPYASPSNAYSLLFSSFVVYPQNSYTRSYGFSVRCFKNPIPPSHPIGIHYQGNDIIVSNGIDQEIIYANKAIGASKVYSGDRADVDTHGNQYQRGNNYNFGVHTSAVLSGSTAIAIGSYSNLNPYNSSNFIKGTSWVNSAGYANTNYRNIRGDDGNNIAKRGPSPEGYHIPSANEWKDLMYIYLHDIKGITSYTRGSNFTWTAQMTRDMMLADLKLSAGGYLDNGNGGYYLSSNPQFWSTTSSTNGYSYYIYVGASMMYPADLAQASYGITIVPFKNMN
ncbi:hypothetical protein AGMMS50249_7470 [candidate division SR1 bacterium]|nr:hypothetical protein AGMMS50249_7470 [candidate division SR1 bacterium]